MMDNLKQGVAQIVSEQIDQRLKDILPSLAQKRKHDNSGDDDEGTSKKHK
jgi:hypothetical protein